METSTATTLCNQYFKFNHKLVVRTGRAVPGGTDTAWADNACMPYADFYRRSIEQRDSFWTEQSALIHWQRPFQQVCDYSNPPFARWFVGGLTNLCHNAVDRHLAALGDRP